MVHFSSEIILRTFNSQVKPQNSNNKEILKTTPISFNNQSVCLRWRLSQVLKQPGLRTVEESCAEGTSQKETNVTEGVEEKPSACVEAKTIYKSSNIRDTCIEDVPGKIGIEDVPGKTGTEDVPDSTRIEDGTRIGEASIIANYDNNAELKSHELQGQVDGFNKLFASVDDNISSNTDCDIDGFVNTEFDDNKGLNDQADLKLMGKIRRRISTVEMDYEKGMIHVTEHSVEVSDFSPIGKDMSHLEYDDSTSADKDLDSEAELGNGTIGFSDNFLDQVDMQQIERNENDLIIVDKTTKMCKSSVIDSEDRSAKTDAPSNKQGSIHEDDIDGSIKLSIHDKKGIVSTKMCNTYDYNDLQLCNKNVAIDDTITSCIPNNVQDLHSDETDKQIKFSNTICSNISSPEQIRENVADEKLNNVNIDEKSYRFYGCFTPYGAKCRPSIYGYRGPLHVWNETERRYTLIYNDTVTVRSSHQREIPQNTEDFHQSYVPVTVCKH